MWCCMFEQEKKIILKDQDVDIILSKKYTWYHCSFNDFFLQVTIQAAFNYIVLSSR